jgi:hypothetical protein
VAVLVATISIHQPQTKHTTPIIKHLKCSSSTHFWALDAIFGSILAVSSLVPKILNSLNQELVLSTTTTLVVPAYFWAYYTLIGETKYYVYA